MTLEFKVVYHPEPEHFHDPLNPDYPGFRFTPTIGLKFTGSDGLQYGAWEVLPEPHAPEEALEALARVARALADDFTAHRLREGVAP